MGVNGKVSLHDHARIAVTGSLMGLAELVPGFSAGTVAYVAGIYARFLALINAVLQLPIAVVRRQGKAAFGAIDLRFAFTLASAMLVTVFVAAGLMRHLLTTYPQTLSAIFFGLVFGAAVAAAGNVGRFYAADAVTVVLVATVVFLLLGLAPGANVSPSFWFVLASGAIAITAWILPGVSGSFMLVVLGIYPVIVGAVADRDLTSLAVFAAGCVIGLASVVNVLTRLLARHGRQVRLVLIAVMLGSMRVLWPWSVTFAGSELTAPENLSAFLTLTAVAVLSAASVVWVAHTQTDV